MNNLPKDNQNIIANFLQITVKFFEYYKKPSYYYYNMGILTKKSYQIHSHYQSQTLKLIKYILIKNS